jgi:uncharacterized protein (DUF433 family)
MTKNGDAPSIVVRTGRGLTIAGTRITLYEVMDYLKANWPSTLIQHWLMLTEVQMCAVLDYIQTHRQAVEAEYQLVLQEAEETRAYWEAKNHTRLQQIARLPPPLDAKLSMRKFEPAKPRWA